MKKQSKGILEKFFNTQNTRESLKSLSNAQEAWISKNIQESIKCIYARSVGGGATI